MPSILIRLPLVSCLVRQPFGSAGQDASPRSIGLSVRSCQLSPSSERLQEISLFRWSNPIAIAHSGQRSAVIWVCQNCNLPIQPVVLWEEKLDEEEFAERLQHAAANGRKRTCRHLLARCQPVPMDPLNFTH